MAKPFVVQDPNRDAVVRNHLVDYEQSKPVWFPLDELTIMGFDGDVHTRCGKSFKPAAAKQEDYTKLHSVCLECL